jgi:hypothetical protein
MKRLIIWQCDKGCCIGLPHNRRMWCAGTNKDGAFADFATWNRAIHYARTEWAAATAPNGSQLKDLWP